MFIYRGDVIDNSPVALCPVLSSSSDNNKVEFTLMTKTVITTELVVISIMVNIETRNGNITKNELF